MAQTWGMPQCHYSQLMPHFLLWVMWVYPGLCRSGTEWNGNKHTHTRELLQQLMTVLTKQPCDLLSEAAGSSMLLLTGERAIRLLLSLSCQYANIPSQTNSTCSRSLLHPGAVRFPLLIPRSRFLYSDATREARHDSQFKIILMYINTTLRLFSCLKQAPPSSSQPSSDWLPLPKRSQQSELWVKCRPH